VPFPQASPRPWRSFPWLVFAAEMLGTALLIAVGLSIVILDFGQGSPVVRFIPDSGWRRVITGFLFGVTGALIAVSHLGKESGAHINPVVTVAFWLMGKMRPSVAAGYVLAQFVGAAMGAVPLLMWGGMGRSVAFGATVPGPGYGDLAALFGEAVTTFFLIFLLFLFLRHARLKAYTPALFPVLYAVMVFVEAPISGTSTNPARSLGPALISGDWHGWWVYGLGPLLGALLGVWACRLTGLNWLTVEVAKLYHFDHDRYGLFRGGRKGRRSYD
jgi:aquaporin Z